MMAASASPTLGGYTLMLLEPAWLIGLVFAAIASIAFLLRTYDTASTLSRSASARQRDDRPASDAAIAPGAGASASGSASDSVLRRRGGASASWY